MEGGLSSGWRSWLDAPGRVERVAHFSFGAWCADCSWELPRLLNSMRGRQAARKQRELAETSVAPARLRAGGLEGLLAAEDVPAGDQDLARDGGLGGVLAGAFGEVAVEPVPGVGRAPGGVGRFDGGPA